MNRSPRMLYCGLIVNLCLLSAASFADESKLGRFVNKVRRGRDAVSRNVDRVKQGLSGVKETLLGDDNQRNGDSQSGDSDRESSSPEAREVLALVNRERSKAGVPPLTLDAKLSAASQDHSNDMLNQGFFDHISPLRGKTKPSDRAKNFGTTGGSENIATHPGSAEDVVQMWMGSPGHRRNILNPQLKRMGLGKAGRFWTQMFGR